MPQIYSRLHMSTTTTTTTATPVISAKTLEDYIPLLAILLGAAENAQLSTIVPGVPGYFLGVFIGAVAKALIGIGQSVQAGETPAPEDILLAILTFLGAAGTAFSSNPDYLLYGTVFGWLGKSLGVFQSGFNLEDLLLALSSILALAGMYFSYADAVTLGSFLMILSKTLPSIGSNGAAGNPTQAA